MAQRLVVDPLDLLNEAEREMRNGGFGDMPELASPEERQAFLVELQELRRELKERVGMNSLNKRLEKLGAEAGERGVLVLMQDPDILKSGQVIHCENRWLDAQDRSRA